MPRRYPPEFRRKVLDSLKSGAWSLRSPQVSMSPSRPSTTGFGQELIDTEQKSGLSPTESAELAAVRRRIAELETELAIAKRSTQLRKSGVLPKDGSKRSK